MRDRVLGWAASAAGLPELRRARPIAERARLGLRVTDACSTGRVEVMIAMGDVSAFDRLESLIRFSGCWDATRAAAHLLGSRRLDRNRAPRPTPSRRPSVDAVRVVQSSGEAGATVRSDR